MERAADSTRASSWAGNLRRAAFPFHSGHAALGPGTGFGKGARAQLIRDSILPVSIRRAGLLNDSVIVSNLPRYALEKVRARTLAVSLKDDLYGTYEAAKYTREQVKGARFLGFERGGHVWIGHHEEIIKEAVRFLHGR